LEWTTRNIVYERERNLAKIYLEALQDFTQSMKGEVRGLKKWKKGRKLRRRRDGEKICGQGSIRRDNGRATQFLVVGHSFDKVDAW
jgi:hypothetical protein